MSSIDGYLDYKRREYCNDVKCPVQVLLNEEAENPGKYDQIRAMCARHCVHSTHEFHQWLIEKEYRIVRPK